jgi:hypothetical protein
VHLHVTNVEQARTRRTGSRSVARTSTSVSSRASTATSSSRSRRPACSPSTAPSSARRCTLRWPATCWSSRSDLRGDGQPGHDSVRPHDLVPAVRILTRHPALRSPGCASGDSLVAAPSRRGPGRASKCRRGASLQAAIDAAPGRGTVAGARRLPGPGRDRQAAAHLGAAHRRAACRAGRRCACWPTT